MDFCIPGFELCNQICFAFTSGLACQVEQDAPAFFVPAFALGCTLVQVLVAIEVTLELNVFLPAQNNLLVGKWGENDCRAMDGRLVGQ